MSDVVTFRNRKTDTQLDDFIVQAVADWRRHRALQQIEWSEAELATHKGNVDAEFDCKLEHLGRMKNCEELLAPLVPHTVRGAQQLLGVALEIMAHAKMDDEHALSEGPVFEIVKHTLEALNELNGSVSLASER